jgi:hypothetical protein
MLKFEAMLARHSTPRIPRFLTNDGVFFLSQRGVVSTPKQGERKLYQTGPTKWRNYNERRSACSTVARRVRLTDTRSHTVPALHSTKTLVTPRPLSTRRVPSRLAPPKQNQGRPETSRAPRNTPRRTASPTPR